MKVVLVLVFFAFVFNLPLAFSDVAEDVLDIGGNPLSLGKEYYIIPAIMGPPGGGVRVGRTKNSRCPVTVLQDYSEVIYGDPVKFTKSQINSDHILLGITPLDIEFAKKPRCAKTSEWDVFEDNKINKAYVGIGGPEAHPDQQMLKGKFYIGKNLPFGYGYKLVFCEDDSHTCSNIGRYDINHDEGGRRLVLSNNPFDVVFVDASNVDGNIKSVV